MTTKTIYLTGTVKWAKVRKPDEKFNDYKINLYPDKNSLVAMKDSGIQVEPKEDEDGTYYTLRRKHEQLIKGKVEIFGTPKVINPDASDFEGLIGNGSGVTAKVSVFDTIKGKGHRLEAVRVDSLVKYEPDGSGSTNGFPDMPPPAVAKASGKAQSMTKPPF